MQLFRFLVVCELKSDQLDRRADRGQRDNLFILYSYS